MLWLEREGETRELPSKPTMTVRRGDIFREEVAGAGGWGDPLDRDPALVLKDARTEFISLASARDDYGVVLDPATWTLDAAATEKRRDELRRARGWKKIPPVRRVRALAEAAE